MQLKRLFVAALILSFLSPMLAYAGPRPKPKPKAKAATHATIKTKKSSAHQKKATTPKEANPAPVRTSSVQTHTQADVQTPLSTVQTRHTTMPSAVQRGAVRARTAAIREMSEISMIGINQTPQKPLPELTKQTIAVTLKTMQQGEHASQAQFKFMNEMFKTTPSEYWFALTDTFVENGIPRENILDVVTPYAPVVNHVLSGAENAVELAQKMATQQYRFYEYVPTVLVVARTLEQQPKAINDMLLMAISDKKFASADKLVELFHADVNHAFQHYFTFGTWHDYNFSYDAVRFLLENHADANQEVFAEYRPSGIRAAHQIAFYETTPEMVRILHLLHEYGADFNIPDANGDRPLHAAAEHLHATMVEDLVRFGADPTLSNHAGLTPRQVLKKRVRWQKLTPQQKEKAQQIKNALSK